MTSVVFLNVEKKSWTKLSQLAYHTVCRISANTRSIGCSCFTHLSKEISSRRTGTGVCRKDIWYWKNNKRKIEVVTGEMFTPTVYIYIKETCTLIHEKKPATDVSMCMSPTKKYEHCT